MAAVVVPPEVYAALEEARVERDRPSLAELTGGLRAICAEESYVLATEPRADRDGGFLQS